MNKVFAIIGPPASGKTTIAQELVKHGVPEMVSHTTRAPRPGEQQGVNYYFVSRDEFSQIDLIERVTYSGYFYGLSKTEVLEKSDKNPVSVVVVERTGLEKMKKLLGKRVESIFIMADELTVAERLIERGDVPEFIQRRMEYAKANREFDNWQVADHVVKNTGSLAVAVRQVLAIVGLAVPKQNNN